MWQKIGSCSRVSSGHLRGEGLLLPRGALPALRHALRGVLQPARPVLHAPGAVDINGTCNFSVVYFVWGNSLRVNHFMSFSK